MKGFAILGSMTDRDRPADLWCVPHSLVRAEPHQAQWHGSHPLDIYRTVGALLIFCLCILVTWVYRSAVSGIRSISAQRKTEAA